MPSFLCLLTFRHEAERRGERERLLRHPFLGGTYGPIYNRRALEAGRSWDPFSTHGKVLTHKGESYPTAISSPYTRVTFE